MYKRRNGLTNKSKVLHSPPEQRQDGCHSQSFPRGPGEQNTVANKPPQLMPFSGKIKPMGNRGKTKPGRLCEKQDSLFKVFKSLISDKRDSIQHWSAWQTVRSTQLTITTLLKYFLIALVKCILMKIIHIQTFL